MYVYWYLCLEIYPWWNISGDTKLSLLTFGAGCSLVENFLCIKFFMSRREE